VRTQLTVLYAGPFFASAAVLLSIPIFQVKHTIPAGHPTEPGGRSIVVSNGNLDHLVAVSAVGLVVMLLISCLLGWLIAGRFLRPLRTITSTARDISATNLHRRLELTGRDDEFTELGKTLNDLFGRLQAAFDSQRNFVANASHELRTPLTAERTLLQVALADPEAGADTLRATCHDVLALGEHQERLIEALLTLATSEQGIEQREPFDLADLAESVILARHQEAERRGLRMDTALESAPASGDPNLVASLVANLVDNALRHNLSEGLTGGRVEIATAVVDGRARISVRNTGTVIPVGEVERLFQPFQQFGTQRIRHTDGHGLGLAIVRAIAAAHDAVLIPTARPGGGLEIEVSFPAPDRSGQPPDSLGRPAHFLP
jgi:signal transduction histidine kinase